MKEKIIKVKLTAGDYLRQVDNLKKQRAMLEFSMQKESIWASNLGGCSKIGDGAVAAEPYEKQIKELDLLIKETEATFSKLFTS